MCSLPTEQDSSHALQVVNAADVCATALHAVGRPVRVRPGVIPYGRICPGAEGVAVSVKAADGDRGVLVEVHYTSPEAVAASLSKRWLPAEVLEVLPSLPQEPGAAACGGSSVGTTSTQSAGHAD